MSIKRYGKVFSDWKIDKVIGRGMDGTVYRVEKDSYGLKDVSAVKAITICEHQGHRDAMSEEYLAEVEAHIQEQIGKALQEVALMQKLRGNTNIVDFYDYMVIPWEEDEFFGQDLLIRMELLHNLAAEQKMGRKFTEAEIKKLGKDICSALSLCHGMQILHRDIKPENIYWNDAGSYKLGDFGISRLVDTAKSEKMTMGAGTKPYMAPEQWERSDYTNSADIYSLGLLMYELANDNRLPFAQGIRATERNVYDRLAGMSFPAPRQVGTALADVIMKACAYRQEERYRTAEEFFDALCSLDGMVKENVYLYEPMKQDAPSVEKGDMYATVGADAGGAVRDGADTQEMNAGNFLENQMEDFVKAYYMSAMQGDAEAQNNLGLCYYNGNGVEADAVEAARWFFLSAEQGNMFAQNNLGCCYQHGYGVKADAAEAVKWFLLAAEAGNEEAQNNLGWCYECGIGTKIDYPEAIKWFLLAAEAGNAAGQCNIGRCYYEGRGIGQNYSEAAKWFLLSAEQGNIFAQNNLGCCYQHGYGVEQDAAKAAKWFLLSAEQGNAEAQKNLGWCCQSGFGVRRDEKEAVKWYRLSAEQGNAEAQRNLGRCYLYGHGVAKNDMAAEKWYELSAKQGDVHAQEVVAWLSQNKI